MVPGNEHITRIYWKLKELSHDNDYRLVVIPIVCSEYYLIKSVLYFNDIIKIDKDCISLDVPYFMNQVFVNKIKDTSLKNGCNTFEKYCKALLKLNDNKLCICTDSDVDGEMYGMFIHSDCICCKSYATCKDNARIFDKALKFANLYPCIPSGSMAVEKNVLSIEEVWELHKRLVTEFNRLVDIYKDKDKEHENNYKHVSCIK